MWAVTHFTEYLIQVYDTQPAAHCNKTGDVARYNVTLKRVPVTVVAVEKK